MTVASQKLKNLTRGRQCSNNPVDSSGRRPPKGSGKASGKAASNFDTSRAGKNGVGQVRSLSLSAKR
eukprot:10667658-Prorocentrum_lima.AAC.1